MDQMLHIGSLALDGTPRVAVVVDRRMDLDTAAELGGRGVDLLEIRLDLFEGAPEDALAYVGDLRARVTLPLLGTIRVTDATRDKRGALFSDLVPLVDAIDVEVDAVDAEDIIAAAAGKTVVVSEHDYEQMPPVSRLDDIVGAAVELGADIVKVAGMAQTHDDVARLLCYCRRCPHPMVAVAMGPMGAPSRLLGCLFGSLYTYSFVDDAVAPGQIALPQLLEDLRRYLP